MRPDRNSVARPSSLRRIQGGQEEPQYYTIQQEGCREESQNHQPSASDVRPTSSLRCHSEPVLEEAVNGVKTLQKHRW